MDYGKHFSHPMYSTVGVGLSGSNFWARIWHVQFYSAGDNRGLTDSTSSCIGLRSIWLNRVRCDNTLNSFVT